MGTVKNRILAVDDAMLMLAVIESTLVNAGYEVIVAMDGETALELVKAEKPDLVLLDVVMPGISGFDVTEKLRRDPRHRLTPIIILTGQDSDEDKLKGLELGADDYIVKPFVRRELVARVNNTLTRLARFRDVNPLTGLMGNKEIEREIERRFKAGVPFSVLYFDINDFKPFNDLYGFLTGDEMIKATAELLIDCIEKFGTAGDFIGHIGGDDFSAIVSPKSALPIAEAVVQKYDSLITSRLVSLDDLERGYITSAGRDGVVSQYMLPGISVAVVFTEYDDITDSKALSNVLAEIKSRAKKIGHSAYVISESARAGLGEHADG